MDIPHQRPGPDTSLRPRPNGTERTMNSVTGTSGRQSLHVSGTQQVGITEPFSHRREVHITHVIAPLTKQATIEPVEIREALSKVCPEQVLRGLVLLLLLRLLLLLHLRRRR